MLFDAKLFDAKLSKQLDDFPISLAIEAGVIFELPGQSTLRMVRGACCIGASFNQSPDDPLVAMDDSRAGEVERLQFCHPRQRRQACFTGQRLGDPVEVTIVKGQLLVMYLDGHALAASVHFEGFGKYMQSGPQRAQKGHTRCECDLFLSGASTCALCGSTSAEFSRVMGRNHR